MKKKILYLALTAVTLSACKKNPEIASTFSTTNTEVIEEITTESQTEVETSPIDVPFLSYSDILSGEYAGEIASLDCVLSHVEHEEFFSASTVGFIPWIYDDVNYLPGDSLSVTFLNRDKPFPGMKALSEAADGDAFRFTVEIYSDNSIGFSNPIKIESITPKLTLDEIKEIYYNLCQSISVEDLLRSPESHKQAAVKFSGNIFQIIEENDAFVYFLLDTGSKNSMVNVSYKRIPGEERLLEDDRISIWGTFHSLKNYTNVLGEKKIVPSVEAVFLER